jgi:hypothetical protein
VTNEIGFVDLGVWDLDRESATENPNALPTAGGH